MRRTGALLVASALALALGAGACGGRSKGAAGAALTAPATLESTLPANTAMVLGVSAEKIRSSKLWERFGPMLQERGGPVLSEFKANCNLDPIADAVSLVVASSNFQDEDSFFFLLKGKWNEEMANRCFATIAEKKFNQKLTVQKAGRVSVLTATGERPMYVSWIMPDTLLIGAEPQDKTRLEQFFTGPRLESNAAFMALLSKADRASTLWGALVLPAELTTGAETTLGARPEGAYFSLDIAAALSAHLGMHFLDTLGAGRATEILSKQLDEARAQPMIGEFMRGITVRADNTDTVVSVDLTEQQVEALIAIAGTQLGGMLKIDAPEQPQPAPPTP